jgi:hypothetical protein
MTMVQETAQPGPGPKTLRIQGDPDKVVTVHNYAFTLLQIENAKAMILEVVNSRGDAPPPNGGMGTQNNSFNNGMSGGGARAFGSVNQVRCSSARAHAHVNSHTVAVVAVR